MVTHHFGTAGLARACNRFHTVGIQICRASDGLLLADLHFMGDFAGRWSTPQEPLTPPSCPNQFAEAQADGSTGIRQLPAQSAGSVFFEPWRWTPGQRAGAYKHLHRQQPGPDRDLQHRGLRPPVATGNSGSLRFFTPNDGFGLPPLATPARSIPTPTANGW